MAKDKIKCYHFLPKNILAIENVGFCFRCISGLYKKKNQKVWVFWHVYISQCCHVRHCMFAALSSLANMQHL